MGAKKVQGINIQVGGDLSGLDKAFKEFNVNVNATQKRLKDVERLLKLDPTNTELLKEKQELLNQKVEDTKTKLESLKNTKAKADAEMAKGTEIDKGLYEKLNEEIQATEVQLKVAKNEAGNFHSGLDKSFKDLNVSLDATQKKLKNVDRDLKLDPKNTDLLRQKQELLNQKVDDTKTKLESLKQVKAQADEEMKRGGEVSQKAYEELNQEIEETEVSLREAEKEAENFNTALADGEKEAKDFDAALDKVAESAKKIGEKSEALGKKMLPVTGAITGIGIATGKMALTFEDSMANINTLLDDKSHLQGYEDMVKKISNETGQDLGIVADGMYQAISSIGDGDQTQQIFNTMSRSAKAGGAEVSESVSLISAAMKGYNEINDSTAQKISDLAFQTAKLGVTRFPEMAKSMQPLFPLANSLNMSYEELFGVMATGTGVTGNTAEVTTQFKAILSGLMKPTADMQALISKYGYSNAAAMVESEGFTGVLQILKDETQGQSDKLATLFGSTEALTLATALTGTQFDTFKNKLGQMGDATGATGTAYDKLDTKGNQLRETVNQMKNTGLELGQSLMTTLAPTIEKVADGVQKFANWFGNLSDKQKETIVKIAAVVAAIGPMLIIFGKISTGISGVIGLIKNISPAVGAVKGAIKGVGGALKALMANPVILIIAAVIAAIVALVAIFKYLWDNCEGFRNFWINLCETIKNFWNSVVEWFKGIPEWWNNLWQGVSDFVKKIWDNIVAFFTETIPAWIQNIINWIAQLPSKIWDYLTKIINDIKQWGKDLWEKGKKAASDLVTSISDTIKSLPEKMLDIGKNIVSGLWNGIKEKANWLKEKISGFLNTMVGGMETDLEIHSPSKKVEKRVGKYVALALPSGMQKTMPKVLEKIKMQTNKIMDGIKTSMASSNLSMAMPIPTPAMAYAGNELSTGSDGYINAFKNAVFEAITQHGHDIKLEDGTLVGKLAQPISRNIGQKQWIAQRGLK